MISRMLTTAGERIYDGEIGRFVEASAIPCHRCGVCCERWQPLVSSAEVERLATYLAMPAVAVRTRFTVSYPFDDEVWLLAREGRGCVFLRYDADGRASCSVHPARPEVCRDWTASLDRRECVDGLGRFGESGPIPLAAVYPLVGEQKQFVQVIRGGDARA